jgi:uncharacterized protein (TIGR00255 family)
MTAFSRVKKNFKDVEITCEIQSQNKRHLDIQLKLAPEFQAFDADIRKVVSEHIARGSLTISVHANFLKEHPAQVHFNAPLAKKIIDEIASFAKKEGFKNPTFQDFCSVLFKERGILQISSEIENPDYFKRLIEESL